MLVAASTILVSARVAPAQSPDPTGSAPTTVPRPDAQENDPFDPDDLDDPQREDEATEDLMGEGPVPNDCEPSDGSSGEPAGDTVVPDDCWGPYASSHYDIGCDEGAWNHVGRKVYCTFTDLAFQGGRSSTATALWLVEWAYAFGVYERLGGPAITIADTYESDLIGPLGLSHLAWFYAVAWAGISALRGKLAMAGGELAASVVMVGLAGILLANPSGYLHGAFDTMGTVSGAVLSTGTGNPPPETSVDADAVLAPLQAQLHRAFVEDPYDHLNWGGADMSATCRDMRNRIVATGPWGNSDAPREAMEAAGCQAQADFNADPTAQRLFGAVLTMTAAMVMVVLVGLVGLTIVVAQVFAVVLFALAPFAALGAILTGGARKLALGWIAGIIRVMLVVIGMSFVMSLLLLTIQALLSAGADADLIERFALVNIVVIAMFAARRRVLSAGADMAANIGGRLSPQASQDGGGWLAAGAVGGLSGFALAGGSSRVQAMARNTAATRMGQQKAYNSTLAAEARGLRPIPRETTNITFDEQGRPTRERSTSVGGAQPMSRRARAARTRVEEQSVRNVQQSIRGDTPGPSARTRLRDLRRRRRGGTGDGGGGGAGEV